MAESLLNIVPARIRAAPVSVAPIVSTERILSPDVLRGAALLGILVMHVNDFGSPSPFSPTAAIPGDDRGLNLAVWFVSQVLFEGKMRALFTMLFGASVILLTSRAEARADAVSSADLYYRRTLWLIGFGLLHAYFIWWGDILFHYGVFGLMLFPLRKVSAKALIVAVLLILPAGAAIPIFKAKRYQAMREKAVAAEASAAAGKSLTDEQREAQRAWAEVSNRFRVDKDQVEKNLADHRGGYWQLFVRRAEQIPEDQFFGVYRRGLFDVAAVMLLGMALLKLGILSAARSRRFYVLLLLAGYGLGLPLSAWLTWQMLASNFDAITVMFGFSAYDLGRLLVALGHIGLLMLIVKAGWLRFLTSRLAAVGQMALTNYLAQSVILSLIFHSYGLGLYGKFQRYQLLYVLLAVCMLQLIVSPIWLRHFRFGPTEWVWRSLTYWRRQPMRLGASAPETQPQTAAQRV